MNDDDNRTDDFRAFAQAGLTMGATLMNALSVEQQRGIDIAVKRGSRLELTFGPLPAFTGVTLLLVEPEGRRHVLGTMRVNPGPQ